MSPAVLTLIEMPRWTPSDDHVFHLLETSQTTYYGNERQYKAVSLFSPCGVTADPTTAKLIDYYILTPSNVLDIQGALGPCDACGERAGEFFTAYFAKGAAR